MSLTLSNWQPGCFLHAPLGDAPLYTHCVEHVVVAMPPLVVVVPATQRKFAAHAIGLVIVSHASVHTRFAGSQRQSGLSLHAPAVVYDAAHTPPQRPVALFHAHAPPLAPQRAALVMAAHCCTHALPVHWHRPDAAWHSVLPGSRLHAGPQKVPCHMHAVSALHASGLLYANLHCMRHAAPVHSHIRFVAHVAATEMSAHVVEHAPLVASHMQLPWPAAVHVAIDVIVAHEPPQPAASPPHRQVELLPQAEALAYCAQPLPHAPTVAFHSQLLSLSHPLAVAWR